MVNLKQLFSDYNQNINEKNLREHIKGKMIREAVIGPNEDISYTWPDDFLPQTRYNIIKNEETIDIVELSGEFEINIIKMKKLAKIITQTDLDLVKMITADDLINYEGNPNSNTIAYILNKNKFLQALILQKLEKRKIFKLLKYSFELKNYNLVNVLVKSLQSYRLSKRKIEKVIHYRNMLESQEGGIFPFEWMLKDCEDSNLNIQSEVASLRFCKIIEKLKEMKDIMLGFRVSEKNVYRLYRALWVIARGNIIENKGYDEFHMKLFSIV